jgi:HEAT repeat protein
MESASGLGLRQNSASMALWSKRIGDEPIINGKPLSHWARMTLDQNPDRSPSPEALEAMQAVRLAGANAIPHLLPWLQAPWVDSMLPSAAVESLKALGPAARLAIAELEKILEAHKPPHSMDGYTAWHNAVEALSHLGPEAVPILMKAVAKIQGEHVRWELIQALGNFGADGVSTIPSLIAWTHDPDSWVRLGAVNALGRIRQEPAVVIQALVQALEDSDVLVRRDAAIALGRFGSQATETVPALIRMLEDPVWQARTGAVCGLGKIGEQMDVVLPLLIQKLHDAIRIVRRSAAFALGDIGGALAFEALMQATDDPDGSVREAVFQSANRIDPEGLKKSGKSFY